MRRLLDVLLTTDPVQRTRLVQAFMVVVAMTVGAAGLGVLALVGLAPRHAVLAWVLLAPGGALLLYLAVRSGWSRRFEDPALTMAQIGGGSLACAAAYALAGVFTDPQFQVVIRALSQTKGVDMSVFPGASVKSGQTEKIDIPKAHDGGVMILTPRIRDVVAGALDVDVHAPLLTDYSLKPAKVDTLRLTFSGSAAPIKQVGSAPVGVAMELSVKGEGLSLVRPPGGSAGPRG